MRLRKFIFITSILLGAIQSATAQNQLVTYPAPKGAELMNDFTVKVREAGKDWKSIDTYLVKVDEVRKTQHNVENASMSYFDFSGEVEVSVTFNHGTIQTGRIRPLSYALPPCASSFSFGSCFCQQRSSSFSMSASADTFSGQRALPCHLPSAYRLSAPALPARMAAMSFFMRS